jgi:hypothetical protein
MKVLQAARTHRTAKRRGKIAGTGNHIGRLPPPGVTGVPNRPLLDIGQFDNIGVNKNRPFWHMGGVKINPIVQGGRSDECRIFELRRQGHFQSERIGAELA